MTEMLIKNVSTAATRELAQLKKEIARLEEELDIKDRAIKEYQKSVIKNAMKVTEKKPFAPATKVTPDQFAEIYEAIVYNARDFDKETHGYDLDDITNDRITITWRGMETSIELGAEVNEYFMEALKETYKQQIGY